MNIREWWWLHRHPPLCVVEECVEERHLVRPHSEHVRQVEVSQMSSSDYVVTNALRAKDRAWLQPWEPTAPHGHPVELPSLRQFSRRSARLVREGRQLPLLISVNAQPAGQITIADIQRGAVQTASLGYWIISQWAGRGIGSLAVAMACDIAFYELSLHRIEIAIRTDNPRSLGVVSALGMRCEGIRRSYVTIDGDWRDHVIFAACCDEVPEGGFVAHLARRRNGT